MADYYPLIARAINGLDKNTVESRASLYDRARAALVAQLRASDPPLDESEITRERLSLEDAIRRIEADAIHANRSATPTPQAPESRPSAAEPQEQADGEKHASLRDQGLRNFREVMAQAEDLGGAAAHANKSARDALDAAPAEKPQERTAPKPLTEPPSKSAAKSAPRFSSPPEAEVGPAPAFVAPAPDEAVMPPAEPPDAEARKKQASPRSAPPPPPEEDEPDARTRPGRSYRQPALIAALVLIVAAAGGVGYWQRHNIKSLFAPSAGKPPAASGKQEAAAPKTQPKITDRVGPSSESPAPAKPAAAPAAAVAQKVVLCDEDPSNPQGKCYVGSAVWHTQTVSPGTGLAPELVVRADVEVPERHMRMTWSLRRNTDKALPASHTIEIMFTLPADFSEGGIANVPGVLMKTAEKARGVPLAGLSVKVTNGYFLIGLSAVDIDVQRNVQFLKERDWFDIPIVYNSGKRAILAMEKGPAGVRAFQEAFKAWGE
ncbi:MAG TPA: hypothetical protein VFX37_08245 [Pseudolabrys sp.]|nr:hypothetical protein [Pseudolabrys sp.]